MRLNTRSKLCPFFYMLSGGGYGGGPPQVFGFAEEITALQSPKISSSRGDDQQKKTTRKKNGKILKRTMVASV